MERMDFQGKHWHVISKIPSHLIDDSAELKKSYRCDLVIKDRNDVFWILEEILEAEFEEV
jgi:predicted transcriptional regulator